MAGLADTAGVQLAGPGLSLFLDAVTDTRLACTSFAY